MAEKTTPADEPAATPEGPPAATLGEADAHLHRAMAEALPQLAWSARPDGWTDYVNRRWSEYSGLPESRLLGYGWADLLHREDRASTLRRWERATGAGGPYEVEYRLRGEGGSYRWFLARAVPVRDGSGRVARWFGTSTDIDDRRRAEDGARFLAEAGALLASSTDFEATLTALARRAVPDAADWCSVYLAEPDGTARRLAVAHADPGRVDLAAEMDRRYPPDPGAGHGVGQVLRSGRAQYYPEIGDAMREAHARDAGHLAMLRELGLRSYLAAPMVARGRPLGAFCLAMAESGRRLGPADLARARELAWRAAMAVDNARLDREAREALRLQAESRSLADALLAAAPMGVAFLDRDLRYVRVNDVMAGLNGLPAAAHVGRRVEEILPAVADRFAPTLRSVIASGRPLTDVEIDGEAPGRPGQPGHWLANYYPASDPEGRVVGLGVIVTEVSESRRLERERREHEARYRALFEQAPLSVQVFEPSGRTLLVNRAWERLWGAPREAVEGYNILEDPQLEAAGVMPLVGRAFAGEPVVLPEIGYDPPSGDHAGDPRWVSATIYPVKDDAGRVREVVLIHEDISGRREAEAARREADSARARAARILESITDAFFAVDRDWRFTYVNPQAEALLRRPRGELLGRDIWEEFPGAREATFGEQYHRAVATGDDVTFEEYFAPLGTWFEVHAYPSADGLSVYFRDVNERHRAEQALLESERGFRNLADSMPQIVWVAGPGGEVEYFNRRWHDYTGFEAGRPSAEAIHPDDTAPIDLRWRRASADEEPFEAEYRLLGADGGYRWFLGRALPIRDESGRVARWFGTATDIDDRKRSEAELARAKEAAEAADRSKAEFLAVLSHELRNPLNPVLVGVGSLLDDPETPAGIRPTLEMARRNVELEARLIDDLLDVTRIARGKLALDRRVVDAHELVRQALDICRDEIATAGLSLEVDLAAPAHHLHADPARVQQVAWNLIKNAVKFTPRGGKVAIRSRAGSAPIRLTIEVTDTGAGIAAEAIDKIFRAFEQGDESITKQFGGLGLGLAISRSLAEAHGGTLTAASLGRGLGATFTLELPTVDAPEAAPAGPASPEADPGAPPGPLNILLVDDSPDTLRVTARLLRGRGHRVTTADGVEAGVLGALEAGPLDVVISDIGLPDGTGHELMRRLGAGKTVPGIALSGFGRPEDLLRSAEAGFSAHLVKPVDPRRLEEEIRRVLREPR